MIDFNASEELGRTRILIYQYIMFKGDKLRHEALQAVDKLKRSKKLSTADLEEIYRALLRDEVFEEFQRELINLLDLLP